MYINLHIQIQSSCNWRWQKLLSKHVFKTEKRRPFSEVYFKEIFNEQLKFCFGTSSRFVIIYCWLQINLLLAENGEINKHPALNKHL